MKRSYRRFKEIRNNAKQELKNYRSFEESVANAVCEINDLFESEIPKYKREYIKSIISSCLTHKALGDEGDVRVSINNMSDEQKNNLKKRIESI